MVYGMEWTADALVDDISCRAIPSDDFMASISEQDMIAPAPTLKALAVVFFSYGIIVGFFVSEMRQAIVQHHLTYGPGFSKDQLRNTLLR